MAKIDFKKLTVAKIDKNGKARVSNLGLRLWWITQA